MALILLGFWGEGIASLLKVALKLADTKGKQSIQYPWMFCILHVIMSKVLAASICSASALL